MRIINLARAARPPARSSSGSPAGRSSPAWRGLSRPSDMRIVIRAAGAPLGLAALPRPGANIADRVGRHGRRREGAREHAGSADVSVRRDRAIDRPHAAPRLDPRGGAGPLRRTVQRPAVQGASRCTGATSSRTPSSSAGCCPSRPAAAPRIAATAASRRTTRRALSASKLMEVETRARRGAKGQGRRRHALLHGRGLALAQGARHGRARAPWSRASRRSAWRPA